MFTNIFMKRKRWNWNSYFHKSNRMKKKKKSFCARRWWRRLHFLFLTTITGFRCCYIVIIYYKMIYMFIHSFIVTWKAKNDLMLFLYNIVCIYTNSANWNVHEKKQGSILSTVTLVTVEWYVHANFDDFHAKIWHVVLTRRFSYILALH